MDAAVAACAGFLLAVLWMDLMFDVQVRRHAGEPGLPAPVRESIATYYRRVTTQAQPMGRLIALVMVVLLVALVVQLVREEVPVWIGVASLACAGSAIALAGARVVPRAVRLGSAVDPPTVQDRLARSIWRDHLACLAAIATLLALQLSAA